MDIQQILSCNNVYIVGAQSRAKTLTGYFHVLFPNIKIEAYLVDDLSQNDWIIEGTSVLDLNEANSLHTEYPVFVATKTIYHQEIGKILEEKGFERIIPVTVDVDNQLRNLYMITRFEQHGRPYIKIEDLMPNVLGKDNEKPRKNVRSKIYMAKSIYDRPLQSFYEVPDYECEIQVGAALTKKRIGADILVDCDGENISEKNRQYCELTALYWIWKHATEEVVGLSQYRRHFILPERWEDIMLSHDIDIILPVPTCVTPSIEDNYRERHDPIDWDYMLEYMQENLPEDYEIAKMVFRGDIYSSCNMFIMRKEIVDEFCLWLFPILDAVVEHGGEKENVYWNRYPGFLSERLFTVFLYKKSDKYKVVYADKNFIV